MSITVDDIGFYKSVTVTDTVANGGRRGDIAVISRAKHNLFPRVSRNERIAGVTRFRKEFFSNKNTDNDIAYDAIIFFENPSVAGDRFYIAKGDYRDTQNDIVTNPLDWLGVGQLAIALVGGESQLDILMENDDFEFPNGSLLHIANKVVVTSQFDSNVKIGDSVEDISSTWYKVAATSDVTYPKGIRIDTDKVLSESPSSSEEWLAIAEKKTIDEQIATGDGVSDTPALTALANIVNGVSYFSDYLPVVKATCASVERTVYIDKDGYCSGYCSAGRLNMSTGAWTQDIVFTSAPDNGTDVLCTYSDLPFTYTGNQVTVELSDPIGSAYDTANTFAGSCIRADEVKPIIENVVLTSSGGTFDDTTYPLIGYNDGSAEDTITITFTSPTMFDCSGLYEGSLGSGVTTANFEPINPKTGEKYFTIDYNAWQGVFQAGDTLTFDVHVSAISIWLKEVVPAGTSEEPNNLTILGWYCE